MANIFRDGEHTMQSLKLTIVIALTSLFAAWPSAAQAKNSPFDELTATYSGDNVRAWCEMKLPDGPCRMSPALTAAPGGELNHHQITVAYQGPGTVLIAVAHHGANKPEDFATTPARVSPFQKMVAGKETRFVSPFRGENHAWILLRTQGDVKIQSIHYRSLQGRRTLYGHIARAYEFAGGTLRYRLMFPRNYDPRNKYPLVLSVSGSAGVGTDNVQNMEMVILGRYLFTEYYFDKQFECFSLVPQIAPHGTLPAPYWPKGKLGQPTPAHPDTPLVNENGWYTQATLDLLKCLIAGQPPDPEYNVKINIDPNRVYYSGFSYGGKGCWEFLKAASGKNIFAAAICVAGWPIGPAYSQPDDQLKEELAREVARYKNIPVMIFAGDRDPMRFGSRAVHQEILRQGGKSTYMEFPNTDHVGSAPKAWGQRDHIQWLFQQVRSGQK